MPTVTVTVAGLADAYEGGNDGLFRFTRTGDTSAPLKVSYSISGTATGGDDYSTLTGGIVFAANSATADLVVEATDDATPETAETVSVQVLGNVGAHDGAYEAGDPAEATVTVIDNDAVVTFTLSDSQFGLIEYDLPWGDVDPEEESQSLSLSNFAVTLAGQTLNQTSATFTTTPTAQFEYGVFVGLTFAIDTSAISGYAYTSVSMSGLTMTAVTALSQQVTAGPSDFWFPIDDTAQAALQATPLAVMSIDFGGVDAEVKAEGYQYSVTITYENKDYTVTTLVQGGTDPTVVRDTVAAALNTKLAGIGLTVSNTGTAGVRVAAPSGKSFVATTTTKNVTGTQMITGGPKLVYVYADPN